MLLKQTKHKKFEKNYLKSFFCSALYTLSNTFYNTFYNILFFIKCKSYINLQKLNVSFLIL